MAQLVYTKDRFGHVVGQELSNPVDIQAWIEAGKKRAKIEPEPECEKCHRRTYGATVHNCP